MSKLSSLMLAISRCNSQYRAEIMAQWNLKGIHTSYLLHICSHPGISQENLAQRMYINKSNVARQAAVLEEAGYITRQLSATDKRVLELYPTDKARELVPQIRAQLERWNDLVAADLSPEEVESLTQLLEKMKDKAAQWMNEH